VFDEKRLEKSMIALKNGDESSFDFIYEQTHRLVYYIIYPIVKDQGRAEDVMQSVYMKVYDKISTYTHSPKAWIGTIARNLAINEYNKNKDNQVIDYETADLNSDKKQDTPLIDMASKVLNEDEFMIVMLCVCEEYKRREVAKLMNLSTSGVSWKLDQALKKLKKEVEK
jgi:RNA polymerase sigma-70 factor (ECF subfamily)